MEPEERSILAQRVREVESKAVSWNKADVWQKVQDRISPSQRSYRLYYYAAAISMIMVFTIPTWLDTGTVPRYEARPHATTVETFQSQTTVVGEIEIRQKTSTQVMRKQTNITEPEHQPVEATTAQSVGSQGDGVSAQEDDVNPHKELLAITPSEVVAVERITPIVGVVSFSEKTNLSGKSKRKKLLHKLETPVGKPGNNLANIVIARNK